MAETRIIKYVPKTTNAGTQYREISPEDMGWVQSQLIRWLAAMAELDQSRDEDSRWVTSQWWHKRTNKVHGGKLGQNTPCSVTGGILNNMLFKDNPQRDLSNKQMDDLVYISHILGQVWTGCTPMRFQIGFE